MLFAQDSGQCVQDVSIALCIVMYMCAVLIRLLFLPDCKLPIHDSLHGEAFTGS